MRIAQDKYVIETLPTDAAKKALADGIAVRGPNGRPKHGRARSHDNGIGDAAELLVVVPNEEPRTIVEGHDFAKLLRRPCVRRTPRHVHVQDFSCIQPKNKEGKDRSKREIVELKEVTGPDFMLVVLEEGVPSLASTTTPQGSYILLNGPLTDLKSKFQQLSSNPLASPRTIVLSHLADERDELSSDSWFSGFEGASTPPPVDSKEIAVPSEEGFGLHHVQGAAPVPGEARSQDEKEALRPGETGAFDRAPQIDDLEAQHRVIGDELPSRTEQVQQNASDHPRDKPDKHHPQSPIDDRLAPYRWKIGRFRRTAQVPELIDGWAK